MTQLKWIPKDQDKLIGVPGKGYIAASAFSQEDLDNLIKRAKNRKIDVHSFLLGAGLTPAAPQLELEIEDPRENEKSQKVSEEEVAESAEGQKPRKPRKKTEEFKESVDQ